MKRKILYGLLTLVGLTSIMLALWLGFGVFTPYNTWTAKRDLRNGIVQIIAIGLPLNPHVTNELARDYGFRYNYIGCSATTELLNRSARYNAVVKKYLKEKHGKDFWQKFDAEMSQTLKAHYTAQQTERVVALIEQQPRVKEKFKLVDSLSKGSRHISMMPMLQDSVKNVYLVKVGEDNGVNFVSYFNFRVDANTMKVLNPSGELE